MLCTFAGTHYKEPVRDVCRRSSGGWISSDIKWNNTKYRRSFPLCIICSVAVSIKHTNIQNFAFAYIDMWLHTNGYKPALGDRNVSEAGMGRIERVTFMETGRWKKFWAQWIEVVLFITCLADMPSSDLNMFRWFFHSTLSFQAYMGLVCEDRSFRSKESSEVHISPKCACPE